VSNKYTEMFLKSWEVFGIQVKNIIYKILVYLSLNQNIGQKHKSC